MDRTSFNQWVAGLLDQGAARRDRPDVAARGARLEASVVLFK